MRRRSTTHPGRYAARAVVAYEPDEKFRFHVWFILAGVIGVLGILGIVLR